MLTTIANFLRANPQYTTILIIAMGLTIFLGLISAFFNRKDQLNSKEFKVNFLLWLSTLFCLAMLIARIQMTGSIGRVFMIWNLFLGWIPFWLILWLEWQTDKQTVHKLSAKAIIILVMWLAFFPNAPYMITDLKYLLPQNNVPFWFDTIMLLSFAWTGLMLGYFSLYKVQKYLNKVIHPFLNWIFIVSAIIGASYGIFLGRYQRWNTWDIVTQPFVLIQDIFATMFTPRAIGMTLVFSIFLILGYLTLVTLMSNETESSR